MDTIAFGAGDRKGGWPDAYDRLDACLAEIGGIGCIRDDFLHLHAMAMTILEGSPLAVATADVDSIWEKAIALQGDISAYVLDCKQALNTWLLW